MIIVDTSVWVRSARHPTSVEAGELRRLLQSRRVVMVGVIMAELLQGTRNQVEFAQLQTRLAHLPYLEATKEAWARAGQMAFELRQRGKGIPLTDCLIAALALEHGHQVYTLDEHFQRVPNLGLHRPKA